MELTVFSPCEEDLAAGGAHVLDGRHMHVAGLAPGKEVEGGGIGGTSVDGAWIFRKPDGRGGEFAAVRGGIGEVGGLGFSEVGDFGDVGDAVFAGDHVEAVVFEERALGGAEVLIPPCAGGGDLGIDELDGFALPIFCGDDARVFHRRGHGGVDGAHGF